MRSSEKIDCSNVGFYLSLDIPRENHRHTECHYFIIPREPDASFAVFSCGSGNGRYYSLLAFLWYHYVGLSA